MPGDPFALDLPTVSPLRRAALAAARPLLRRVLGLDTIGALYDEAQAVPAPFATAALRVLDVTAAFNIAGVDDIPKRGPMIVAANHPHGALDGLLLLDVIGRARPDVRLIANHLLSRIPELRDQCFFVDPFASRDSAHRSLPGLRAARLWLGQGGALVIFPAGEVAHTSNAEGLVVDSPWRSTIGALAVGAQAQVLPIYIDGANSALFYAAARVHRLLRTALLPRELVKRRGTSVAIHIGRPLSLDAIARVDQTADTVTRRIRDAVESCRAGLEARRRAAVGRCCSAGLQACQSIDPVYLADDVRNLPGEARLLSSATFDVYCAEATHLPHVLHEIGRLRERTFRAVGEGTGKASDIDAFDASYLHLFVWNRTTREVVGAYRLGRTDQITESSGVDGLYTRTLFRYDRSLFDRLPPALELGRSFVRPEYQRDPQALLLLWKGICAFVQRHPRYRVLFGAVSISSRYTDRTRDMLIRFLEQNHLHQQLSEAVSSLRPYAPRGGDTARVPRTIAEADRLASEFEPNGQGMPVLLRQYLKLNARVLGFNVDPSFGDVLDALMMVDLLQVDARILHRYFGSAGARSYLAHHESEPYAA
jgi:putative hemolysin